MPKVDLNLPLDDVAALVDFGDDELEMDRYKQDGTARADARALSAQKVFKVTKS